MSKDIEIRDTVVLFGKNANDLMAVVSYEGDIGTHEPQEIHVDTEAKTLSVVFENGQEEKICDLSSENIETVNKVYAEMKAAKKEICMGFYQVDSQNRLKDPSFNVDVLLI